MSDVLTTNDLVVPLQEVRPAVLAAQSFVPELSDFSIQDSVVSAFNGELGIAVTCPGFPLKNRRVPPVLLGYLQHLPNKKVKISVLEDKLIFQVGRTKLEIPSPVVDKPLYIPRSLLEGPPKDVACHLTKQTMPAVAFALRGVGSNPAFPPCLGILLQPSKKGVMMFSTNDISATKVKIHAKKSCVPEEGVFLPTQFTQQVCSMLQTDSLDIFQPKEDEVLVFLHGKKEVYGKLPQENLVRLSDTYKSTFSQDGVKATFTLTKRVFSLVQHAGVVSQNEDGMLHLSCASGDLTISLSSAFPFEGRVKGVASGSGEIRVSIRTLLKGISNFKEGDTASLHSEKLVMHGITDFGDTYHAISSFEG